MIRGILGFALSFICQNDLIVYLVISFLYVIYWVGIVEKDIHVDLSFRVFVAGLSAASILLPGGFIGSILARPDLSSEAINHISVAISWFVWSILVALFALTVFPSEVDETDSVASGVWIPVFGGMQFFAIFFGASRLLCAVNL